MNLALVSGSGIPALTLSPSAAFTLRCSHRSMTSDGSPWWTMTDAASLDHAQYVPSQDAMQENRDVSAAASAVCKTARQLALQAGQRHWFAGKHRLVAPVRAAVPQ